MSQYLYTDSDFSVKGPFGVDELVRQGINLETLIWQEGMEDWVPAGSVPAVRRALSAAPVASVADVQHEAFVVEAEPTGVQKVEDFVEKTDVVHVNAASDVIPPAPPVVPQQGAVASEGRRGTWGLSLLLFLLAVLLLIPIGFVVGKSFLNSKVAFSDEAYAPADSTPVEGVLNGDAYPSESVVPEEQSAEPVPPPAGDGVLFSQAGIHFSMDGTMGLNSPAHMELDGQTGSFFYTTNGVTITRRIAIHRYEDNTKYFVVYAYSLSDGSYIGKFIGHLSDNSYSGIFENYKEKQVDFQFSM